MPKYQKLQRTYFLNVIIINLITITFLGSIWVLYEYLQYKEEVKLLKKDFIEEQKTTIKNEVENAISYIDNINKDTQNELTNHLNTRLSEVFQIINSIYNQNKGNNAKIQEQIKSLLKKVNSGNQPSSIFILTPEGLTDFPTPTKKTRLFPTDKSNLSSIIQKVKSTEYFDTTLIRHLWSTKNRNQKEAVLLVKHFKPFNWIIGVGVNYDEFTQQAQNDVILRLSHVRFGKNRDGYLFANRQNADPLLTNGIVTIGDPNKWELEDPFGIKIMQEQYKAAQKPNGDYIYYSWRKIFTIEEKAYGIDKPTSQKVSFIKGYKPWNWMVGAGFYLDDIDIVIAQKHEALNKEIRNHVFIISAALIFSIFVSLIFVRLIQKRIKYNFTRFIHFFNEASKGLARIDLKSINYLEFKELAIYANRMVEQRELAELGFKQIVEVFPFPICIYKNNRILYLNPQWFNLIGYETSEIPTLSRVIDKCFHSPEEQKTLKILLNGSESSSSNDQFFKVSCKDGQVRHMKVNFIKMRDKSSMITLEDYTYRKKVEDDLNAARIKAEESDSLKSAFLANMSHEIRTPMNAIIGFSTLLQKDGLADDKRKKYLQLVHKSSESLLNLLNDILDISKIEAGQLHYNIVQGNLRETFHQVDAEIKSICNTFQKHEVEVVLKYNLSNDQSIFETDFFRLKQILMNLLSNAVKFTNSGFVEYGCSILESKKINFYVKDSGIGIKSNHLKHIFNRFTKVEEDSSQLFRGAGLGLAITKKLVEALGGEIWVESEYGKGSIFYFSLPVKHSRITKQNVEI